nr:hypothetical protein [Tanacetum cinerariifolium]
MDTTMGGFVIKDQADYYSGITRITVNGKNAYELIGKFLDDLLKLFTHDIKRTKTYEDYENELNDELKDPWSEDGVPYEMCDHIFEPFRFINGKAKWPTCSSNEDGFCNG